MIIGLQKREQKIIENILSKFSEYSFFYYGSRVKGNFWKGSDLDILIHGSAPIPNDTLEELKDKFDNSDLHFIVNFCDYYSIGKSFYEKIEEDLVPCISKD